MIDALNGVPWHYANSKVILFGEHAVVYGYEALAASIPNAVKARARKSPALRESKILVPSWSLSVNLVSDSDQLLVQIIKKVIACLGLPEVPFVLEIVSDIPSASGLGASAAVAVASIRALAACYQVALSDKQCNDIAYECEKLSHGTPSGLDNTLATYGGVLRYRRGDQGPEFTQVNIGAPLPLLVVQSGRKGLTAETVARVRAERDKQPEKYGAIFERIADIVAQGIVALESGDLRGFSRLLTENHACLSELEVSCEEIEQVLTISNKAGATGGKLTGSGDGGSILVAFDQGEEGIQRALTDAEFEWMRVVLGGKHG